MIDAAIKIRLLQDFGRAEDEGFDASALQLHASRGLNIGNINDGGSLSLRESCNEIVHATGAKLEWQKVGSEEATFEYWTGIYRLFDADQSGKKWVAAIHVADWCTAMMRFNAAFLERIDWTHVLKWDE
jgi:hypothetical protein